MSQFNPGDIAIVTRRTPTLIGSDPFIDAGGQVELIARGDRGEEFTLYGVTYRLLAPMWAVERGDMRAIVAERYLIPLRGDFAPEREKSSEVPA
ncbi:hypothetical protein ACNFCJ_14570 [Pseudomonas sp. NY15364]|uniref:hypothetical protein n=1 Tax=Pseudomonas sp. NY15364 TaxID=3400353 RepID=UPI003A867BC9